MHIEKLSIIRWWMGGKVMLRVMNRGRNEAFELFRMWCMERNIRRLVVYWDLNCDMRWKSFKSEVRRGNSVRYIQRRWSATQSTERRRVPCGRIKWGGGCLALFFFSMNSVRFDLAFKRKGVLYDVFLLKCISYFHFKIYLYMRSTHTR